MFFFKITFPFALILLIFSPGILKVNGNVIGGLVDGISKTTCIISFKSEFDKCYEQINSAYKSLNFENLSKDNEKVCESNNNNIVNDDKLLLSIEFYNKL